MKALFQSLLAFLFLLGSPWAGGQGNERLEKLKDSFESRRAASVDQHLKAMEKLRMSYRVALERLQDRAQKSGKLEDVLPVRDEIARIDKDEDPLPSLGATASADLKKLRETYDQAATRSARAHAEELVGMTDKMIELLDKESESATKAGKIEEALATEKFIETLGVDESIMEARTLVGGDNKAASSGMISLLKAKRTVLDGGTSYWVGTTDGKDGKGNYDPAIPALVPPQDADGLHLFLHPPTRVEFTFDRPITRFSTDAFVARNGDVVCRLFIGKRKASEVKVSAAEKPRRRWEVKFKPTDTFVLEVDMNGTIVNDLFYLLSPVVE
jgi:hypothetical protein